MAERRPQETEDGPAVIERGTTVVGHIEGEQDLLIRGRVDGTLELSGVLTIEAGAVVRAELKVRSAVIGGILIGSVSASESIHLLPTARVVADLRAKRLLLERGAQLSGALDVEGEPLPEAVLTRPTRVDTERPRLRSRRPESVHRTEPIVEAEARTEWGEPEPSGTRIDPSPPVGSARPRRTQVRLRRSAGKEDLQ